MIIVWRGLGLPIMLAGGVATGGILAPFGMEYLSNHAWPRMLAFSGGAAVIFILGKLREDRTGRQDSVYWIPMKAWAVMMLVGGLCFAFVPLSSTPVAARTYSEPARVATVNGFRLQGIFCTAPGSGTAIINNQTVSVGDKIGDCTVASLEPESVTLQAANGKVTVLRLSDSNREAAQ